MVDKRTLEQLAQQAMREPRYPNPAIPPSKYYQFFRLLAARIRPRYSVELGVCGGGGSLHLALGYPHGAVLGVDLTNEYPDNIKHIQATCPNFTFWQMDAAEAAIKVEANGKYPIDILFIDTVHTYDATIREFNTWRPLMHRDGIVILDDLFRPGMLDAWNELQGRDKIRLDFLHLGGAPTDGGLGCILL